MTMKIGFLGLGRMGAPMARHVLAAGHELRVWNRSAVKAEPFAALGVPVTTTPAQAAAGRQIVVLMLTDPVAVQQVLFGAHGVAAGAEPGTLIIDGSTIGPAASRAMALRLSEHGIGYVDAPVFGSVGPAAEGTLGVFAGGRDEDVATASPLLHLWGAPDKVIHVGPVGSGNAAKLIRNLTLGLAIVAIGEALRLADSVGLPRAIAAQVLAASPLGTTHQDVDRLEASTSHRPADFTIDMLTKDLGLCLAADQSLTMAAAAHAAGVWAHGAGHGSDGSRSLALHVRETR
jgi:3-hydroxyisobutyrate dehydrogenase-like beta-hydroxyacid dehydrogenase